MLTLLAIPAVLTLTGLLLWRKIRADAVSQNGARVGSALPAEYPAPGATECRLVVVRGEPGFQEKQPFDFRGVTYAMLTHEHLQANSTVLRRWRNVTCEVLSRKPGR